MKMLERKMNRTTNRLIGNLNNTASKATGKADMPLKDKIVGSQSNHLKTANAGFQEVR